MTPWETASNRVLVECGIKQASHTGALMLKKNKLELGFFSFYMWTGV